MTHAQEWPVGDQAWVARYRLSITGKNVPEAALEVREHELLNAVLEMKLPAAELFGDADELAHDDAAELATVDEAVRTSLGGGAQPALREIGGTLVGIGAVAGLLMIIRTGWSVDIDAALTLVAASVAVAFVGWIGCRALFSAGRLAAALCLGVGVGALAMAAIAIAAALGAGHLWVRDAPVPLVILAMLAPGVGALVVASRMSPQELQSEWDDAQWLRRFRGGLRARLMPAATAREHVAEVELALTAEGGSAYAEFGHPLTLARELAAADRTARTRLWAVSTTAGVVTPLLISVFVAVNQSWGALTIPVAVVFALATVGAVVVGWERRPWNKDR